MTPSPQHLGKWLVVAGLVLVGLGLLVICGARLGFFRLPGDLQWGGKSWRVYVPVTTCIVISALLTLLLWFMQRFRR